MTAAPLILVVDDEMLVRWSVARRLQDEGLHVVEADSARAARDAFTAAGGAIGLVLLDIKLPDGSGLDVLERLRALDPACRFIVMTAHGSSEDRLRALALGASHVLLKPFDHAALMAMVRAELAAREASLPHAGPARDAELLEACTCALARSEDVPATDVRVSVRDGVVTLDGVVRWVAERQSAEAAVRFLRGCRAVRNRLVVEDR